MRGRATGDAAAVRAIARTIEALLDARAAGASVCPSEVARALWPQGWRARMDEVRAVARALAARGKLRVTQRGRELDPARPWRGPVRLARAARQSHGEDVIDGERGRTDRRRR
jgi:hypothetical protein